MINHKLTMTLMRLIVIKYCNRLTALKSLHYWQNVITSLAQQLYYIIGKLWRWLLVFGVIPFKWWRHWQWSCCRSLQEVLSYSLWSVRKSIQRYGGSLGSRSKPTWRLTLTSPGGQATHTSSKVNPGLVGRIIETSATDATDDEWMYEPPMERHKRLAHTRLLQTNANPVSRHIVLMRTNVIHLCIVSQSMIFWLFSCYTERNAIGLG